jgi:hypothetical protein
LGSLAGKLFTLIAYVGIGCASYLLLFRLVLRRLASSMPFSDNRDARVDAGGVGAADTATSRIRPAEVMERVSRPLAAWHGVASVLYLIVSGLGYCWCGCRDVVRASPGGSELRPNCRQLPV